MKRIITVLFCFLTFACDTQHQIERPRLVLGIVVDQMRQEYLFRFYDKFGSDGFKRLMNKGFMMRNAHYNYIPTYTGPGHASVYTGTTPRVHGVIGNNWFEKYSGKSMYCAGDSTVAAVGGSPSAGKISARNLLTTTITDELGLYYQNRAKIVGISIKDRGAALPAGHNPTGAYWYDGKTGEFMSSTYYMDQLPEWVVAYNTSGKVEQYMSGVWDTSFPIEEYVESAPDNRPGEKLLPGKSTPTFPYNLKEMAAEDSPQSLIRATPYGNTLVKDMALAAIEGEAMGQDEITDFLAISFSATDYIGHTFGPYSKEVEDAYIKLDNELAELFKYLDEKVGLYQYIVFLTADHAVAEVPQHLKNQDYPVDYFSYGQLTKDLDQLLAGAFGHSGLIASLSNGQVFFDKKKIKQEGLNEVEVKNTVLDYLNTTYGVASAYDAAFINHYSGVSKDVLMLAAGYNVHRSGDILLTLNPGWIDEEYEEGGTTHGSHYSYDTHVPMLFYGQGIPMGESLEYHTITDLAPTVSMLLNIKLPSGATGQPIVELF